MTQQMINPLIKRQLIQGLQAEDSTACATFTEPSEAAWPMEERPATRQSQVVRTATQRPVEDFPTINLPSPAVWQRVSLWPRGGLNELNKTQAILVAPSKAMNPTEQESILTLCLLAAFADDTHSEVERTGVKQIAAVDPGAALNTHTIATPT